MKNPILKKQWNWPIYYYYVYNLLFVWHSFFAYQNPHIFIVTSFNCIFKNQIFEINSVFVVRRLRVILTLTSLFTTNLAILKLLKLSSDNLIA